MANFIPMLDFTHICVWLPLNDSNLSRKKGKIKRAVEALIQIGYLSEGYRDKNGVWHFIYRDGIKDKPSQEKTIEANGYRVKMDTEEVEQEYLKAQEWLSGLKYFRYLNEINRLPFAVIAGHHDRIKREFEALPKYKKRLKFIYDAFREAAGNPPRIVPTPQPSVKQLELFGDSPDMEKLLAMIDEQDRESARQVVNEYYDSKGPEYVTGHITGINEKKAKGKIKENYAGYLRKALEQNYTYPEQEKKAKKAKIDTKENEIRALIDSKGGVENVRYGGGRIQLCEAGIINLERNSVTPWACVRAETIHALEDLPDEP